MSEDVLEVRTNGRVRIPWGAIVVVLWGLFIGLLTWTAQREMDRNELRLVTLEDRDAEKENAITILRTLRPEDRQLIEAIQKEQTEQGKILARIAARLGIEDAK